MKTRNQLAVAIITSLFVFTGCGNAAAPQQSIPTEAPAEVTTAPAETTEAPTVAEAEPTEAPTEAEPAEEAAEVKAEPALADGVYSAKFDTDGSMFHVNEVCEGRGTLTVKDGEMTMHIVLPSKNTVNLFYGLAENAQKDGAELIDPVVESVTYPDGLTEEVHAFDIPVPYLEEEYDLALIGTKGVWYDHKVSVSDPVALTEEGAEGAGAEALTDGSYEIEVSLEGGSGKATITSPAELTVEGGEMTLKVEWSSPNYDYMKVEDVKYDPVNTEGNSVFLIPVDDLAQPLEVIGDTVAMSEPHEIEYTIVFDEDSIQ
ncbi:MAG: iron transporter [Lachnospiraceae bacterium]|nr:iron transporter [Lachnospiraceae bacterium]